MLKKTKNVFTYLSANLSVQSFEMIIQYKSHTAIITAGAASLRSPRERWHHAKKKSLQKSVLLQSAEMIIKPKRAAFELIRGQTLELQTKQGV